MTGPEELRKALEVIRLVVLDVDGVLTDGTINLYAVGHHGGTVEVAEAKSFHVRDGLALKWASRLGLTTALLTARTSPVLAQRAREIEVGHVLAGVRSKPESMVELHAQTGLGPEVTAYLGDDLPDLPVMACVALPVAVADAAPEVRAAARFVTTLPGGRGAVREVVEMIMRAQGLWSQVVARHRAGEI